MADDLVTVQAPATTEPLPNLDAGFVVAGPGIPAVASGRSAIATITAITGAGSFSRVTSVAVDVGDPVVAGQLLATFESGALEADARATRANRRVAIAQVALLAEAIDKTFSADATISKNRSTVSAAIVKLKATRSQLADKLDQLKRLAEQLQRMPQLPPGVRPPGGGAGATPPNPAAIRAAIAKLEAAISKIDAGLLKAQDGLGKLSSASATVADARGQLRDMRKLARIAADASALGVDVARYRLGLTAVTSPVDGVVVQIAQVGDVVAPGASVAVVRRAGETRVETWLSPEEAARVAVGDEVIVTADWFGPGERL